MIETIKTPTGAYRMPRQGPNGYGRRASEHIHAMLPIVSSDARLAEEPSCLAAVLVAANS